jgi:hypothetical protein
MRESAKRYRTSEKGRIATRARIKRWRASRPEFNRIVTKRLRLKYKTEVLNYYGAKCNCCGENEEIFLTLDHIQGDGNKHRKTLKKLVSMWRWIIINNYPSTFQILCFNCNSGKAINDGVCPHATSTGRNRKSEMV